MSSPSTVMRMKKKNEEDMSLSSTADYLWYECQHELLEMRHKIITLEARLQTSEQLNKHLTVCNVSLVVIVQLARVMDIIDTDGGDNTRLLALIQSIKEEESRIEHEKENLRSVIDNYEQQEEFDDKKICKLIQEVTRKQLSNILVADKGVQTVFGDNNNTNTNCGQRFRLITENLGSIPITKNSNINSFNTSMISVDSDIKCELQSDHESDNWISDDINVDEEDSGNDDNNNEFNETIVETIGLSDKEKVIKQRDKTYHKTHQMITEYNVVKHNSYDRVSLEEEKRIFELIQKYTKVDDYYECDETIDCTFRCKKDITFYNHLQQHKLQAKRLYEKMDTCLTDDKYICDVVYCQFISEDKYIFYEHYRQHVLTVPTKDDTYRPYRCDECGSTFVMVATLKQHQKKVHPDQLLMCPYDGCTVTVKSAYNLKQHINNIHLKLKPYPCDWPGCEYSAFTPSNLKSHKLKHSQLKHRRCDWPACEFTCKANWTMIAHKRTHTNEKPFACEWPGCVYRCSVKSTLITHKRIHTGEKPFKCLDCDQRFAAQAGLQSHQRQHSKIRRPSKRVGRPSKMVIPTTH
ncbi:zinc finger protein 62-like [Oppia nitens]|uniref:zinc finger protein 62-like n=1 Tax=Oppia nitens TaxID=1686743 RepID=UPI0023DACBC0|nr:zinc finger protein 62-like [Oppia nitens]